MRLSTPTAAATAAESAPATPPAAPEDDDTFLTRAPETYNSEEYRWVPVRRRPRTDGWTEEKQRRFIEVLADTGLVSDAAKDVGMTRESAYKLRRAAHADAFARAWDAARHHAGSFLEDTAFERAIEGVAHNVYDENGEVVCTKRVYNDRLLTFLLSRLKPERYGAAALTRTEPPPVTIEAMLREMEPQLPAPLEDSLNTEVFEADLLVAEIADGVLPQFLREQRPKKSETRLQAEAIAAQEVRGKAVNERLVAKKLGERANISRQDMVDITRYLDPSSRGERSKKRFR